jgi:transposase-like protein
MNAKRKLELAQLLYTRGVVSDQSELAVRVGVTPQTISRWKKKHGWENMRKSLLTTRQEELRRLYDQLKELNDHIRSKPEGQRYANSKEADTITKITSAIRNLETEVSASQTIDVFMKFNEFIQNVEDLQLAQKIVELQDAFVKSLL